MAVFLAVFVTFARVHCTLAKPTIKKLHLQMLTFAIECAIEKIVIRALDLYFRFQMFKMGKIRAVFLPRDVDLNFQGQPFRLVILTSSIPLLLPSDKKSGIFHRLARLRMLYIVLFTLTYLF